MTRKVLVLGGTGLLGHATIDVLIDRGYDVTSIALPPMPAEDLFEPYGDRVVSHLGDVTEMDDDEVLALLEGHHAVMYAIGADERVTPPAPSSRFFYEANVLPTQRLAALARRAGVAKFVVYGSYFAHFAEAMPELELMTEGYPLMRLLQEQVAFAEGDGAMVVTSLRLPYIFGTMPGRMPLWKMFMDQLRSREQFPAHPEGVTAAVTTRQVGQAAVGAMERGEHRGTYPISGYALRHEDFYRTMVELMEIQTAIVPVPVVALEQAMRQVDEACAQQGVEHGISMVKADRIRGRDLSVDPALTQEALGFEDDDVPAAIEETIRYILEHEGDAPAA